MTRRPSATGSDPSQLPKSCSFLRWNLGSFTNNTCAPVARCPLSVKNCKVSTSQRILGQELYLSHYKIRTRLTLRSRLSKMARSVFCKIKGPKIAQVTTFWLIRASKQRIFILLTFQSIMEGGGDNSYFIEDVCTCQDISPSYWAGGHVPSVTCFNNKIHKVG